MLGRLERTPAAAVARESPCVRPSGIARDQGALGIAALALAFEAGASEVEISGRGGSMGWAKAVTDFASRRAKWIVRACFTIDPYRFVVVCCGWMCSDRIVLVSPLTRTLTSRGSGEAMR